MQIVDLKPVVGRWVDVAAIWPCQADAERQWHTPRDARLGAGDRGTIGLKMRVAQAQVSDGDQILVLAVAQRHTQPAVAVDKQPWRFIWEQAAK